MHTARRWSIFINFYQYVRVYGLWFVWVVKCISRQTYAENTQSHKVDRLKLYLYQFTVFQSFHSVVGFCPKQSHHLYILHYTFEIGKFFWKQIDRKKLFRFCVWLLINWFVTQIVFESDKKPKHCRIYYRKIIINAIKKLTYFVHSKAVILHKWFDVLGNFLIIHNESAIFHDDSIFNFQHYRDFVRYISFWPRQKLLFYSIWTI